MDWKADLEGKGVLYPDDLSLTLGNHKVEGRNQLPQIALHNCAVVQTLQHPQKKDTQMEKKQQL